MQTTGRMLILAMATTFILLAYQTTGFLSVLGYIFGTILGMALLASFARGTRYSGKRGD